MLLYIPYYDTSRKPGAESRRVLTVDTDRDRIHKPSKQSVIINGYSYHDNAYTTEAAARAYWDKQYYIAERDRFHGDITALKRTTATA